MVWWTKKQQPSAWHCVLLMPPNAPGHTGRDGVGAAQKAGGGGARVPSGWRPPGVSWAVGGPVP